MRYFNNQRCEEFRSFFKGKQAVAFTMDNVLVHTMETLQKWYASMYGEEFTLAQYADAGHNYHKLWDVTPEQAKEIIETFHFAVQLTIPAFPDAVVNMAAIRNHIARLMVVSARFPRLLSVTQGTVHRLFPETFEEVRLCNGKSSSSKATACAALGCYVLVEESLSEAIRVVEEDDAMRVILLQGHRTQNLMVDKLPERIILAKDWSEITSLLTSVT